MPIISYALDSTKLTQGVNRAKSSLASLGSRARGIGASLGKMFSPLNTALAGLGAGFGAIKLAQVGDEYTNMAGQLEYLTGSTEDAAKAQELLYDMSQRTGTSVLENSKALSRFALASEMTGLSIEENVTVLGSINALLARTGVSGQEASAGMVQLGQALASGRLQGDEFRSISENLPALMNNLAKELGVTRGELKAMSTAGELTSEVLGQAFLTMGENVESGAGELPITIGRMWTRVVNATQRMWDTINDETGILSFVAQGFDNLATWVEQNTDVVVAFFVEFGNAAVEYWPTIKLFFDNVFTAGKKIVDWFRNNPDAIPNFIGRMVDSINTATPTIFEFFGLLGNVLGFIGKVTAGAAAAAGAIVGGIEAGNLSAGDISAAAAGGFADPYLTGETPTGGGTTSSGDTNIIVSEKQSRSDIVNIKTELDRNEARL